LRDRTAVLTMNAVDGLGREGVLVDAPVAAELGCRAVCVVTALMAAREDRVEALEAVPLALVGMQLETALASSRPAAVRTGIFRDAVQIGFVAGLLRDLAAPGLVVAPVARVAGVRILDDAAAAATRRELFPLARVAVVRAAETGMFAGETARDLEGMKTAAARMRGDGARAVLVVGLTWRGRVLDVLDDGGAVSIFDASRIVAPRVDGLAGAHAMALASHLARGTALERAVDAAQRYVAFRLQRGA